MVETPVEGHLHVAHLDDIPVKFPGELWTYHCDAEFSVWKQHAKLLEKVGIGHWR